MTPTIWKPEWDALLRATYPTEGAVAVVRATNFTREQVTRRAKTLRLRKAGRAIGKAWQPHEDAVLRARYLQDGADVLADVLGRKPKSIQERAHRIGLTKIVVVPWPVPQHDYSDADFAVHAWRYPTGPAQLMGRV
jgi:hypothetical protein